MRFQATIPGKMTITSWISAVTHSPVVRRGRAILCSRTMGLELQRSFFGQRNLTVITAMFQGPAAIGFFPIRSIDGFQYLFLYLRANKTVCSTRQVEVDSRERPTPSGLASEIQPGRKNRIHRLHS